MKFLYMLALCALVAPAAIAEVPESGALQSVPGTAFQWQVLEGHGTQSLQVLRAGQVQPVAEYDISTCSFCEGEEDNCTADGIFSYSHESKTGPTLYLVCHVGAHSQYFGLFRPLENTLDPVAEITGAYSVSLRVSQRQIWVEADGYTADEPARFLSWPE